jgi:hypothetical protein
MVTTETATATARTSSQFGRQIDLPLGDGTK